MLAAEPGIAPLHSMGAEMTVCIRKHHGGGEGLSEPHELSLASPPTPKRGEREGGRDRDRERERDKEGYRETETETETTRGTETETQTESKLERAAGAQSTNGKRPAPSSTRRRHVIIPATQDGR